MTRTGQAVAAHGDGDVRGRNLLVTRAPSSCRARAGSPRAGSRACARPARELARRHLGVDDARARGHPLHVAGAEPAAVACRVLVLQLRPRACRSRSRSRGAGGRARPWPRPGAWSIGPISSSSRNGSKKEKPPRGNGLLTRKPSPSKVSTASTTAATPLSFVITLISNPLCPRAAIRPRPLRASSSFTLTFARVLNAKRPSAYATPPRFIHLSTDHTPAPAATKNRKTKQ